MDENVWKIYADGILGVVSDTHLGSVFSAEYELNDFYDVMAGRGIRYVLHAGDLAEGIGVYPGQHNELVANGLKEQVKYVVRNYPKRKGVKTCFVTGNHEEKTLKNTGRDIAREIGEKRRDIILIGRCEAKILLDDEVKVLLVHDKKDRVMSQLLTGLIRKGRSALQKKYDVIIAGHKHTMYAVKNSIYALRPGCFQRQNEYLRSLGKKCDIGGMIIEYSGRKMKIEMLAYGEK